jgi:hypothetical protein
VSRARPPRSPSSQGAPAPLPPTTGFVAYGVRSTIKDPPARRRGWFTRHFGELEEQFGPFATALARRDALSLCTQFVEWQSAVYDLEAARRQREDGKGRRASASAISRLQKRSGLLWGDYTAARGRFEELVKGAGRPRTLAAIVAEAHRATPR